MLFRSSAQETKIALQLMKAMDAPFEPSQYEDEYQQRLMDALQKKIQGQEIVKAEATEADSIADLMDALKQSVVMQKKSGSMRKKAIRH